MPQMKCAEEALLVNSSRDDAMCVTSPHLLLSSKDTQVFKVTTTVCFHCTT